MTRVFGCIFLASCCAATASATPRLDVSVMGGRAMFDSSLADFQWDVSPRAAWAAQAVAVVDRAHVGLRVERVATDQDTGLGDPESTTVARTSVGAVTRWTAASTWGTSLWLGASAGWMRLGFSPDEASIPVSGSSPIDIEFAPINEWVWGVAAGVSRPIAPRWSVGLNVERESFRLDTAHRRGDEVVESREGFGNWTARMELTWTVTPG